MRCSLEVRVLFSCTCKVKQKTSGLNMQYFCINYLARPLHLRIGIVIPPADSYFRVELERNQNCLHQATQQLYPAHLEPTATAAAPLHAFSSLSHMSRTCVCSCAANHTRSSGRTSAWSAVALRATAKLQCVVPRTRK